MEWQIILALALIIPLIFLVPILVWALAVSGLYVVIKDTFGRRVRAYRRALLHTVRPQ